MISVLFVCTGNQYRSPIAAAAFLEQLVNDGIQTQWQVTSAGTWTATGHRAPKDAIEIARSFGLNIEGHVTHVLDAKMLEEADLILVMEKGHKESIQFEFPFVQRKVHLLSDVAEGIPYDIPDPLGTGEEAREIIRDMVALIRLGCRNIYRIAESIQSPF